MNKRVLAIVVTGGILASGLAFAGAVGAQTTGSSIAAAKPSMRVVIGPAGNANLEGTISSVSGSTLNVASWGGTWSVDTSSAKLVRRFGGTSSLSEFQTGDSVAVTGTALTSGWVITAKQVRDNSIQVKNAAFSGTISNLSGSSFTLTTTSRGAVSVTVNSDAKVYVDGKVSSVSALANGMRATISGVWDRNQSTVNASRVSARSVKSTGGTTGGTSTGTSGTTSR